MAEVHKLEFDPKGGPVQGELRFLHGKDVFGEWRSFLSTPGAPPKRFGQGFSHDATADTFSIPQDALPTDAILAVTFAPIGGGQVDTGYFCDLKQGGKPIGNFFRPAKLDGAAVAVVDGIQLLARG